MMRRSRLSLVFVILALWGITQPLCAQESKPPKVEVASVEAALAALEADAGIEAAVKDLLRPKYQQAIEAAKGAAEDLAKAEAYREATSQPILTSSVPRVILAVGVGYGTDTKKARQIMLDVAIDHPLVMEDPAPLATFEEFADSNLILRLRAYLPEVENRLQAITELNDEIDQRFAREGIEIAFPQRDLHIRSTHLDVDPGRLPIADHR
jgi:hypothetical protein